MYNLQHLIDLLQPYNDAYSIELKRIITDNIDKPIDSLRDALNECKETPPQKLHKLYPFEINNLLSEIIYPYTNR